MYEKNEECILEILLEDGKWISNIKVDFQSNPMWMLEKIAKLIGNKITNLSRSDLADILQKKLVIQEYTELNPFCTISSLGTKYTYLSYRELTTEEMDSYLITQEFEFPVLFHSVDDFPAIEQVDGTKVWFENGVVGRKDKPAIVTAYGVEQYYQNGVIHRDELPAEIYPNGTRKWYQNGKLQRNNDQPSIVSMFENKDGEVIICSKWYQNGYLHRENNQPTIVYEKYCSKTETK